MIPVVFHFDVDKFHPRCSRPDSSDNGFYVKIILHKPINTDKNHRKSPVVNIMQGKGIIVAKKKFERTKPHVNVGTIGHIDHGKTTTTAAITRVLVLQVSLSTHRLTRSTSFLRSAGERYYDCSHVEYETENRHCPRRLPRHADYIKNRLPVQPRCGGFAKSAADLAPCPVTREHALLARQEFL